MGRFFFSIFAKKEPSLVEQMKKIGIYVHVPFCVRRCPYCGFYSNACGESGYDERISEYFGMLEKELLDWKDRASGTGYSVDSIYFGGGTPSLAGPEQLSQLISCIGDLFEITDDAEISMEANPGTLTPEKLRGYKSAGVNRLSIGLQSFDKDVLHTLGRIHTGEDFLRSFSWVREAGFDNISTDLMFGIPGQSREIWASTVEQLAELKPEHVSFYSLQIEEGTKFYEQYKMGDMVPVSDEDDRGMYHDAIRILSEHGYRRYEISNAALPGYECRHNLKYWTFSDYIGIGASASSFAGGIRRTDPAEEYMDFAQAGFPDSMLAEKHENTPFDNAADYMITGLRLCEGVDEEDFRTRFGRTIWEMFPGAEEDIREFYESGCVKRENGRLFITEKGIDISNRIMACFV